MSGERQEAGTATSGTNTLVGGLGGVDANVGTHSISNAHNKEDLTGQHNAQGGAGLSTEAKAEIKTDPVAASATTHGHAGHQESAGTGQ